MSVVETMRSKAQKIMPSPASRGNANGHGMPPAPCPIFFGSRTPFNRYLWQGDNPCPIHELDMNVWAKTKPQRKNALSEGRTLPG
jgi:hypothetical protein